MQRKLTRRSHEKLSLLLAACLAALLASLTSVPAVSGETSDKLTVYAVNYPLKYFTERIAGEYATVVFPAPPDEDPAYWVPDISAITAFQQADLIVLNGAAYAKWVEKVTLPRSKLVDTSADFEDQYIKTEGAVTHSHGPSGKHAHEGVAFTTWIDFSLAAKQAKAIAKALARKRPELKGVFDKSCAALEKDLFAVDQAIQNIVAEDKAKPLLGSHPVYQYFSRRYGLNMRSVHWEPDEAPGDGQWAELQDILNNHPAQWMIWEGEPTATVKEKLKTMGIRSLVFDPCGNAPDAGDFLSIMRQNVKNLEMAF